ncbi:ATP-binding protein [Variovorax sp. J31P207]|uniref:ATP-binding protein n=1 Tax=Variovorax sp. J31P207 TaxID=3053510 RepID=UPI002576D741|nr:ATP-binding protein [Variovorax sp. J31P207]MDM0067057.1 ATP-binding protein [Variovorax sp. J31P207]
MVEIYDDRIEVTSPGTLLLGKKPDRLIGTTPESRNEKRASSFRRYRICEDGGTELQKIVTTIASRRFPAGAPPHHVRAPTHEQPLRRLVCSL